MRCNPSKGGGEALPSKVAGRPARKGDVYRIVAPNGGGSGSPIEREPDLVLEDYRDDLITLEEAREIYGVEIDLQQKIVLEDETAALRASRRSRPLLG
jgi:N-methylhydantoinase B